MASTVAFRVDASLQIGTGHVMRCLTLADALRERGARCHFICREHPANLITYIRDKGHVVHGLPMDKTRPLTQEVGNSPVHARWLGSTQAQDARQCVAIVADLRPNWIIVDHYALDALWESALAPHCHKLMVIDDLADRVHQCDVLLDQTFGRTTEDYKPWVPAECALLCGSSYTLLRPEFAKWRAYSLRRRKHPQLKHLLITMGGVDKDNVTGRVLAALGNSVLPPSVRITVVMGIGAPWLSEVRAQAECMAWPTQIRVDVRDMAKLMANSDLAIGAAGATSWERCCLGLPTIMLVVADNQAVIARALCDVGAAFLACNPVQTGEVWPTDADIEAFVSPSMSDTAAAIVDGLGTIRVTEYLSGQDTHAN